jgi:hypothetical protein
LFVEVVVDEIIFCLRKFAGFEFVRRRVINGIPEDEPQQADRAGEDERPFPALVAGDPRHTERRDDGTHVRA